MNTRDGRSRNVGLLITLAASLMLAVAASASTIWLAVDRTTLQDQVAGLQADLLQSHAKLAAIESDLRAKTAELIARDQDLAEKDQRLADRELALAQASQPELPIQITFRPALLGAGQVAVFRNVSPQTISAIAHLSDPRTGQSRNYSLAIDSQLSSQIGHAEGWPVTPGQVIEISANGYKTVSATAR